MIGVIVNTLTVLAGSAVGLLAKKAIPKDWTDLIFKGIALCVLYIGITGSMEGENTLIMILSMAIGAMTIVGSLQAGLTGDNQMLFTKATLDGISSIVFAASFGIGVVFSAAFVFSFQGALVMLARLVEPFLDTQVISEMTCVGSLLIIALSLNMLGITKLKVMNYTPAIFMPIIIFPIFNWIGNSSMIRIDIIIRQKRTLPLLRFNETLLAESFFILFFQIRYGSGCR